MNYKIFLKLVYLAIISLTVLSYGQEHVQNGGFENVQGIVDGWSQLDKTQPWIRNGNGADLLTRSPGSSGTINVPLIPSEFEGTKYYINYPNPQNILDNNILAQINTTNSNYFAHSQHLLILDHDQDTILTETSELLSQTFNFPMVNGNSYTISFDASLSENSTGSRRGLAVYFANSNTYDLWTEGSSPLRYIDQSGINYAVPEASLTYSSSITAGYSNSFEWENVSLTYSATDNWDRMYLGFFKTDYNTAVINTGSTQTSGTEQIETMLFLDNISVVPDCSDTNPCALIQEISNISQIDDDKINVLEYFSLGTGSDDDRCCIYVYVGDNVTSSPCYNSLYARYADIFEIANGPSSPLSIEPGASATFCSNYQFSNFWSLLIATNSDELTYNCFYGDDPGENTFFCNNGNFNGCTVACPSLTANDLFTQEDNISTCCYTFTPPDCLNNVYYMRVWERNAQSEWVNYHTTNKSSTTMSSNSTGEDLEWCFNKASDFDSNGQKEIRISMHDEDGLAICAYITTLNICEDCCEAIEDQSYLHSVISEDENECCYEVRFNRDNLNNTNGCVISNYSFVDPGNTATYTAIDPDDDYISSTFCVSKVGGSSTLNKVLWLDLGSTSCSLSILEECNFDCENISFEVVQSEEDPCCSQIIPNYPNGINASVLYVNIYKTEDLPTTAFGQVNKIVGRVAKLSSHVFDLQGYEICNYSTDDTDYTAVLHDGTNPICTNEFTVPGCSCECPSDLEDVLSVSLSSGTNTSCSDPLSCEVEFELLDNIDSECYDKFSLSAISGTSTTFNVDLEQVNLSNFSTSVTSYCIPTGASTSITLELFQDGETESSCTLTGEYNCGLDRSFLFEDNEANLPCVVDPNCSISWTGKTGAGDPESNQIEIPIEGSSCYIIVNYKYRIGCDPDDTQDLFIESYTLNSTGCSQSWTNAEIYEMTLTGLIRNNPMGFLPESPPSGTSTTTSSATFCKTNWRVSKATCWTQWYREVWDEGGHNNIGSYPDGDVTTGSRKELVFESCDSECCVRQFKVCKYRSPSSSSVTHYIEDLGVLSSGSSCTTSTKTNPFDSVEQPRDCHDDCEDMDSYKKSFKTSMPEITTPIQPIDPNALRIQYIDLIYSDRLEFRVKDCNGNNLNVTISDINGHIIDRMKYPIIGLGENYFYYDKTELKSGTYIYTMQLDGKYLKTNKFQVIK